jgi:C1A family cysteine protease
MPTDDALDLTALHSALRDAGQPWQPSHNSMTALKPRERLQRLGVPLPEGADLEQLALQGLAAHAVDSAQAAAAGTPISFDLRNVNGVNYTTPIRDQGGCGSCVAFGVVATMEAVTRYTRRNATLPIDYSEAHLYYCWGKAAGATCASGWMPDQALTACQSKGITFEDYFPYTAGDQGCTVNADWPNKLAKVTSWQNITGNVAAMKQYISTYGAIDACFVVYQDFFAYGSGVYRHVSGDVAGGHCVSVVGYDDSQSCWIAKNSWGSGWGDGGYFRIGYGECALETWQVCGVQGVDLRLWLSNQQIQGLWSNEADANIWAYVSTWGWRKLSAASAATSESMLVEVAAAKAAARPVSLFDDFGTIEQLYVL